MSQLNILRGLARSLQRWLLRSLFREATRRVIHGLPVGVVTGPFGAKVAFEGIASGLELVAQYEPTKLARLRQDAQGILVWDTKSSSGVAAWHYGIKLVIVDAGFLCDSRTEAAKVATTLVHEATHARLDRFGYPVEKRARIEAICFRRERAFARRLPECDELVAEIDRQLQRDPSWWTDDAHRMRIVDDLAKLGVPTWLVRAIQLFSGRRAV